MKNWYLYILPILMLLPVFLLRDYTVDNELRYLSIADEALRDGSLFAFHNHGAAYADKPPLYFWFMMAFRSLTGTHCMALIGLLTIVPAIVIMYGVSVAEPQPRASPLQCWRCLHALCSPEGLWCSVWIC